MKGARHPLNSEQSLETIVKLLSEIVAMLNECTPALVVASKNENLPDLLGY